MLALAVGGGAEEGQLAAALQLQDLAAEVQAALWDTQVNVS